MKMENIGVLKMVTHLKPHNPEYIFGGWINGNQVLITSLDVSKAELPSGYKFDGNVISNGDEVIYVRKATKNR